MKPKLIIATGNAMKFREIAPVLSEYFDCEQREMQDYHEIQGSTEEIIKHKLAAAYRAFNLPVLVEDTSAHFSALNGFPGPYIRDFFSCFTPYEMGKKFVGSRITTKSHMGIAFGPEEFLIVTGVVEGLVIEPKMTTAGDREFDLFTQYDGTDGPAIEFSDEEKNAYSHRGNAIRLLLEKLKEKNAQK